MQERCSHPPNAACAGGRNRASEVTHTGGLPCCGGGDHQIKERPDKRVDSVRGALPLKPIGGHQAHLIL